MFDGAYPPGVTGKMIDDLENKCCCENCSNYFHGSCTIAEHPYTAEEIEAMTDEEYEQLVSRYPDDYCEEWEGE